MTLTERRWLASIEHNPRSRAKQTMARRKRLCLACLRIAARRNKAARRRALEVGR